MNLSQSQLPWGKNKTQELDSLSTCPAHQLRSASQVLFSVPVPFREQVDTRGMAFSVVAPGL